MAEEKKEAVPEKESPEQPKDVLTLGWDIVCPRKNHSEIS